MGGAVTRAARLIITPGATVTSSRPRAIISSTPESTQEGLAGRGWRASPIGRASNEAARGFGPAETRSALDGATQPQRVAFRTRARGATATVWGLALRLILLGAPALSAVAPKEGAIVGPRVFVIKGLNKASFRGPGPFDGATAGRGRLHRLDAIATASRVIRAGRQAYLGPLRFSRTKRVGA